MGPVRLWPEVSTDGQSVPTPIVELKRRGEPDVCREGLGAHSDRSMLLKALAALDEGRHVMCAVDSWRARPANLLNTLPAMPSGR